MSELKPCPFCGKQPYTDVPSYNRTHQIQCISRHCMAPSLRYSINDNNAKQMAIEQWNDRYCENKLQAEIDGLKSELAEAKAAAVQWVTYDEINQQVPDFNRLVAIKLKKTIVPYAVTTFTNDVWTKEGLAQYLDTFCLAWAYLPEPL